MNNVEIKEILDDLDYCIAIKRGTITLNHKDCGLLLDYITNLQQENERLKEEQEYNNYCDEQLRKKTSNLEYKITTLEDYKSRVEKAVEYIKTKGLKEEEWQNGFCIKATATYTREEIFDLLNILQNGSETNDKN